MCGDPDGYREVEFFYSVVVCHVSLAVSRYPYFRWRCGTQLQSSVFLSRVFS